MGHSLGRECCRSFSKATQGRTTLRAVDVSDFATLSPQRLPPYASHLPSSALLHSLCTPSVARTESGTRHCFAEPSIIYRLAEVNPLQPRNSGLHLPPWVLLGRGRLSLPTVALPLSPSLASPPPSLRSGTSPQGDLCVFLECACRHSGTACGAAYISARTKAVGSVFVRCGLRPPPGAQRTSDRKKWGPPPHFYFLSDNRFALRLRNV